MPLRFRRPQTSLLIVSGIIALCVVGIFLNRKNLLVLLMAIELMLLAVNMNFVAFSHYLQDLNGQIFVFSPSGKQIAEIDVPERPLQLVFGGPDRKTLFILAHHALFAAQVR